MRSHICIVYTHAVRHRSDWPAANAIGCRIKLFTQKTRSPSCDVAYFVKLCRQFTPPDTSRPSSCVESGVGYRYIKLWAVVFRCWRWHIQGRWVGDYFCLSCMSRELNAGRSASSSALDLVHTSLNSHGRPRLASLWRCGIELSMKTINKNCWKFLNFQESVFIETFMIIAYEVFLSMFIVCFPMCVSLFVLNCFYAIIIL